MGVVAGAPGGHRTDEAEQTPQAPVQPQQTADPMKPATEQMANQAQRTGEQPQQTGEQAATPGFGERGRMRRRARFLRKARELAYRDLGGLVFDLHRFGQRNDPLVLAKLATLRQIDTELRELEAVLRDRRPVTVLREVGIAACPRCAAIHGSDDRFCPGCGLAFDTNADRPISTAPVATPKPDIATAGATPTPQSPPAPMPQSVPAPAPQSAPSPTPQAAPAPVTPTATPIRAPGSAPTVTDEDEPTQIIRPPAAST
jgi:hypothetical protein